jgi:3-oxoacyl-[acyl-carrier protein] reductase
MKGNETGGSIINVSSGAIDSPTPGIGLYAITKAAVAMLTKTLATEVGPYGIRVNALCPGATMTKFTTWRMHREDGTLDREAYDQFVERMRARSPLGEVGEAEDQAHILLHLASDAARWTTGTIMRANGGQTFSW